MPYHKIHCRVSPPLSHNDDTFSKLLENEVLSMQAQTFLVKQLLKHGIGLHIVLDSLNGFFFFYTHHAVVAHLHGHDVIEGYPHTEINRRPTTMVTVRLGVTRC